MDFKWDYDKSLHCDSNAMVDEVTGSRSLNQNATRQLLNHILEIKTKAPTVAVFDLDSTLFNNFPRQSQIMREFGKAIGEPLLDQVKDHHWVGWSFETPMRAVGLSLERTEKLASEFRGFWKERFFTSSYCELDEEILGASQFVSELQANRNKIIYVTGRQESMRTGTARCLEKHGFPLPNESETFLWMKPQLNDDDDLFKSEINKRLNDMGEVLALFDNEPKHINRYHDIYPTANAIHLATDHSNRPVLLHPSIPSIRNFSRAM